MHNSKSFTDEVTRKHMKSHLNVTGVHFLQVANLKGNLKQFRPSEIHYLQDPTARNGNLDMRQPENVKGLISSVF